MKRPWHVTEFIVVIGDTFEEDRKDPITSGWCCPGEQPLGVSEIGSQALQYRRQSGQLRSTLGRVTANARCAPPQPTVWGPPWLVFWYWL